MKASFQRADLFVFVELRSPVKPGMTYGTGMTMLFPDAERLKDVDQDVLGRDLAGN